MENEFKTLPKEVVKAASAHKSKMILLSAAFATVCAIVFAYIFINGMLPIIMLPLFIIAAAAVILFKFGLLGFIIDKDWTGIITDKRQQQINEYEQGNTTFMESGKAYSRGSLTESTVMYYTVETDGDKKIKFTADKNHRSLFDYYDVGDRVHHFAGFKYPIKQEQKSDTLTVCVGCGYMNKNGDERCINCKMPLCENQ